MDDSAPKDRTLSDVIVAAVIVNYCTPHLARECLASLAGERKYLPHLRAVLVDGGSGDGSEAELAQTVSSDEFNSWVSYLPLTINGGFGWANNQAIMGLSREHAPPDFIYLINPDAKVRDGAVATLVRELLDHPTCGAAGSQLANPDGSRAASAFRFPSAGRELVSAASSEKLRKFLRVKQGLIEATESLEVDWVTGASVMLRSAALRESGLFDDGFFLYFEEVELMHRLRSRGWSVRHAPASEVIHLEGVSTGLGQRAVALSYPRYWYESRRRYHALTGGKRLVIKSNLALIGGRAIARAKQVFRSRVPELTVRVSDLLRFGFLPRKFDSVSEVPSWGQQAGKAPAWMNRP